jgi:HEAT repeats/Putative zinc-finger
MHCENCKAQLQLWWTDQLSPEERAELKAHLDECEDCRLEFAANLEVWELMGRLPVPEPSGDMQAAFNVVLNRFKESVGEPAGMRSAGLGGFWQLFRLQPWLATAFSLLLIAGGVGLGYAIRRPVTVPVSAAAAATTAAATDAAQPLSDRQQLAALSTQVHEMREMMMLSLLQNPSASERMRGVSYTSDIKNVNPGMADALLATLNNDPNVNVRLTTLEALTHFANDPAVREGLVQSILQQDSPLVQSALADVMLKLQEKRSIRSFKKLLQQKDLNGMVRTKIRQTINRLT